MRIKTNMVLFADRITISCDACGQNLLSRKTSVFTKEITTYTLFYKMITHSCTDKKDDSDKPFTLE